MIPLGHSRSVFAGHLPGGEIFGWSLWAAEAPLDQAATQAQATAFANTFVADTATGTSPLNLLGADAGYDSCTVYSYLDNSGHASHIAAAPMVKVGTNASSGLLPNQCSLVCTLTTANAGRRAKGRIYLPVSRFALSAGGQFDNVFLPALATWMSSFIAHLNADIGAAKVVVLSQTAGTSTPVTGVKLDSRMDIQRRRANRQVPQYTVTHVV